jgi:hypothetical protein
MEVVRKVVFVRFERLCNQLDTGAERQDMLRWQAARSAMTLVDAAITKVQKSGRGPP